MATAAPRLVLGSASPRRRDLLAQIGLSPDLIAPANINEDPIPGELPRPHALRLAQEKAAALGPQYQGDVILSADTVVGVGRRILPKTETADEARACLTLMSGRAHRVFTGVCVIDAQGVSRTRISETRLKMKRLTEAEIEGYIASDEWRGKAGGYGIQGFADAFIISLSGSYSGVVGLPLFETRALLIAAGLKL